MARMIEPQEDYPILSLKHYHDSPAGSSPESSISSHDEIALFASDRFFEPEYPSANINSWRSGLAKNEEVAMYYSQPSGSDNHHFRPSSTGAPFMIDAASLYPPPTVFVNNGPHRGSTQTGSRVSSPFDSTTLGKHALPHQQLSSGFMPVDDAPPSKRSRKDQSNGRVAGACTRCKRLKMKCTFTDDDRVCARCIVGGHECVVLGRKPRSPGMREILRKQIREKDAMIDNLLARLNPTSSMATPLSIAPSRLAFTPEQRQTYRDVLAYYEKGGTCAKSTVDGLRKFDVSTLEEEFEYESESEESVGMDDLQESTDALHIHPLPAVDAPAGLLAKTALESKSRLGSPASARENTSEGDQEDSVPSLGAGIGNLAYFEPGPSSNLDLRRLIVERQAAPDILLSGLITNEDVGKLFDIYWKWINPVIPLLDENIHTPSSVLGRCPFLFTVVCAISSRFYEEKPEIYTMAIHMAKAAAANAFLDGWKTVEMCQAFALMASYMPPARRWDEDRTWFYSGVAFRLAVDLDLGRIPSNKPADERGERELLNRLRAYVICYIIDRCFCINLAKPTMMPENELIRSASSLFYGWKHSQTSDGYLVSLIELFRVMARYPELTQTKTNAMGDDISGFVQRHKVFSEELNSWHTTVMERCAAEHSPTAPAEDRLRMALMYSVYQFCRLVTFSTGLQRIVQAGRLKEDITFFTGCLQAASAVINCVMDRVIPTGFIKYSPEYVLALSAFGTAVLIRCLRPEFACKLDGRQEERITQLVKRLTMALDSDEVGVDGQPTPRRCYAKFLEQVLTSRMVERQRKNSAPRSSISESVTDSQPLLSPPFSSLTQGQAPPPDIKVANQLPPSDPAFLHGWDMMENQQLPGTMNALLGDQIPAGFMSFGDQSWFSM